MSKKEKKKSIKYQSFIISALKPLLITELLWGYCRFTSPRILLKVWKYILFLLIHLPSNFIQLQNLLTPFEEELSSVFKSCMKIDDFLYGLMYLVLTYEFIISRNVEQFNRSHLKSLINISQKILNRELNSRKLKLMCFTIVFLKIILSDLIDIYKMLNTAGRITYFNLSIFAFKSLFNMAYVEYVMMINIFIYLSDQLLNFVNMRKRNVSNDYLYKISYIYDMFMESLNHLNRVYAWINITIHVKLFVRSVLSAYVTALLFSDFEYFSLFIYEGNFFKKIISLESLKSI